MRMVEFKSTVCGRQVVYVRIRVYIHQLVESLAITVGALVMAKELHNSASSSRLHPTSRKCRVLYFNIYKKRVFRTPISFITTYQNQVVSLRVRGMLRSARLSICEIFARNSAKTISRINQRGIVFAMPSK